MGFYPYSNSRARMSGKGLPAPGWRVQTGCVTRNHTISNPIHILPAQPQATKATDHSPPSTFPSHYYTKKRQPHSVTSSVVLFLVMLHSIPVSLHLPAVPGASYRQFWRYIRCLSVCLFLILWNSQITSQRFPRFLFPMTPQLHS